ncbi:Osmotin, thaumatin-like protein [Dentipellis sp. KUC8613]|nr:Osmotin, thaumatin-like protein [Dentipellis sp. KUC8613]
MRSATILSFLGLAGTGALARTFTVANNCPYTVWPAIFTDLNVGSAAPNFPTGWESPPLSSVSFFVPDNWRAGRIWGRRECNFKTSGPNSCVTGGCNGGLLCDPHSGTGVPPATLAQFTLSNNAHSADFYDVSVVDGFNIPMRITTNAGCPVAECAADLNAHCPAEIAGPRDPSGTIVGCKSACEAGLASDPSNSPNCCTGSYNTPATCPPSGVDYYYYFKDRCPRAYAYAYDDGTALQTCDENHLANYVITFCP